MHQLLFVVGATGTGKTSLALKIAKKFNGELISADSRQVYRGMNIGTGKDIPKRGKLPIVVGGTGLYISALEKPMTTISIPPNTRLREQLEMASVRKLQQNLKHTDPIHYAEMNDSDRKNPRRLVRAIEIAQYLLAHPAMMKKVRRKVLGRKFSTLRIGLQAPKHLLYKRIDERVNRRLEQGAEKEIRSLLNNGYGFDLPAFSALGYRQWKLYFAGVAT